MIYQINKKHDDFKIINKCADIKANEESRFSIQLIKVVKGKAHATDGHRAITGDITDRIKDGFYHVVKRTPTAIWIADEKDMEHPDDDIKYPDLKKAFKREGFDKLGKYTVACGEHLREIISKLYDKKKTAIDYSLLPALILKSTYTIYAKDCQFPVIFEADDHKICVMPLEGISK